MDHRLLLIGLVTVARAATAHAQAPTTPPGLTRPVTDVEVPTVVIEIGAETAGPSADEELDLANIVQSAAKGVTTVQEAPAIVTVVTADEIRERQYLDLTSVIEDIPGWGNVGLYHSTFVSPTVRGQAQAFQYLHDGLSLFEPFINVTTANRVQPIEVVKRVEAITGPGGVQWGSAALLGILNLITKDAEDVDGAEMGATAGDGSGDRNMVHAYAMFGKSDMLDGKLKIFAHGSIETYQGPTFKMPLLIFHDPLPFPNSANTYGPLTATDAPQSIIANFSTKITYDKLQLRVSFPFGEKFNPLGLSGEPVRQSLPQDASCPYGTTIASCVDPYRTSRTNRSDNFDRYGVLEYRTRFAGDQAGLTGRAFFIQFDRDFDPLQILAASTLVPGGLAFETHYSSYRAGGAFDGDIELSNKFRIQYGGEAFNEWKDNINSTIVTDDVTRLPLLCPREFLNGALVPVPGCALVFAFPANRTELGAYINPQWRPNSKLIFDLGGRVQIAPGALGTLTYPLNTTVSGTVVWNFIPNWHLKLNYAQGFRAPTFIDTESNGEDVQFGGNPNLKVETSDATQAEINARVYKGDRRIRELSFRVDGSFTQLHNLIQIESGNFVNSGERAIESVEFLAKLYVQGGHRVELGYTWLRIDTDDKGLLKSIPENSFNLATVFSLIPGKLSATTNIKVSGSTEDPNRIVEYRGSTYDVMGLPVNPVTVAATDLVMDRLPPMAELTVGVAWTPIPRLTLRANIYDALAEHVYQPDVFFDYEPHLEYLPNPNPGFRAYLSALYTY